MQIIIKQFSTYGYHAIKFVANGSATLYVCFTINDYILYSSYTTLVATTCMMIVK